MLDTVMENENKIFTNILIFSKIMIADHGLCDQNLRKEINIIV